MIVLVLGVMLFVFIFQVATILLLEFRRPAHATAWLFILFLIPLVGFVLYYFLAQEYRRSRKANRKADLEEKRHKMMLCRSKLLTSPADLPDPHFKEQYRLFRGLIKEGALPILGRNCSKLYNNGQDTYDAMLQVIQAAKHHIHMSSYIVRDDDTGRMFQHALIEKAKQGVDVRFLYDGIGSVALKDNYVRIMREGGVKVACFFPLKLSFMKKRMNYRNHRKIIVVDGLKGFIGGINVGDEYIGMHPRLGYWRDTHLQLEGDSVYRLQEVFLKDWEMATHEKLDQPEYMPVNECDCNEPVQIVPSGPNRRGDSIHDCVYAMVIAARKRIWITTPYFIPSASIAMALHDAALSGLDVRILIPYEPDSWLVHYATLSYVEEMMKSGVRVWQYRKGFVHAKTMVVDQLVGVVGSANMDLRSLFSNFEINAHLFDPAPIASLEADFLQDMKDSTEINLQQFHNRPQKQKIKEALSRILSPLL
jgi:cardiolipin synthase